jgi:hypothetical protein
MAELIYVLGDASSGKTTSLVNVPQLNIKGLPPNKTGYIDVIGKGLPFKGWKNHYNKENKNYLTLEDYDVKLDVCIKSIDLFSKNPNIKYIVIDDYQYILSYKFINDVESKRTSGNAVFERYNEVLSLNKRLIDHLKKCRKDQICILISHSERVVAKDGFTVIEKMKAIGQATDKYLTPEGMVNIILFAVSEMEENKPVKYFLTQTDGEKVARSPIGMFDGVKIPNDMGKIVEAVENFYN